MSEATGDQGKLDFNSPQAVNNELQRIGVMSGEAHKQAIAAFNAGHKEWREANPGKTLTLGTFAPNLDGMNLAGIDLQDANLDGVSLSGANLSKANLSGANLERTFLEYAVLEGADLRGASLRGARLTYTNFMDADLTDAILPSITSGVDKGINMAGATFTARGFLDEGMAIISITLGQQGDSKETVEEHLEELIQNNASVVWSRVSPAFIDHTRDSGDKERTKAYLLKKIMENNAERDRVLDKRTHSLPGKKITYATAQGLVVTRSDLPPL